MNLAKGLKHTLRLATVIEAGNLESMIVHIEGLGLHLDWGRIHIEEETERRTVRYGPLHQDGLGQIVELSLWCPPGKLTPIIRADTLETGYVEPFDVAQTILFYYAQWFRWNYGVDEAGT